MSTISPTASITLSFSDFELLVRRVVHEAVRDEFERYFQTLDRAGLEYLTHEGPDDPKGDAELLAEALDVLDAYRHDPSGWVTLEELEAELACGR